MEDPIHNSNTFVLGYICFSFYNNSNLLMHPEKLCPSLPSHYATGARKIIMKLGEIN